MAASASQSQGHPLTQATIARARSQSLRDHRPELRSCLNPSDWIKFAPAACCIGGDGGWVVV
jgi:hypothetical protein